MIRSQIRNLGDKFKCFSMPFYDYTIDSGKESFPLILHSVFGGDGDEDNLHCIDNGSHSLWGIDSWPLMELCDPSEDAEVGCCLKRRLDAEVVLNDAAKTSVFVEAPDFLDMATGVGRGHSAIHSLIGGGVQYEDDALLFVAMSAFDGGYSIDDPIFMPLHTFSSYLRALWAACHGYDGIDPQYLEQYPSAYTPYGTNPGPDCVKQLDDGFNLYMLEDAEWSLASNMSITPRSLWNLSDWGVAFDFGTFYGKSGLQTHGVCDANNIEQSPWFIHRESEDEDEDDEANQHEDAVVDHDPIAVHRGGEEVITAFMSIVLVFVVAVILLKCYKDNKQNGDAYKCNLLDRSAHYETYGTDSDL